MNILITIFAFIVTIGILITIHEWGHFYVARKCGVKVLRFSIGFGKPLLRYQRNGGTEYCLAAIPLGGYVKMLDEREGIVAEEELPFAFNRQSVGKRIAIVLAGPVANLLFAMLAFTLVYTMGIRDFAPFVTSVVQSTPAEHHGLQVGDEIISLNGTDTPTSQSVRRAFLENKDVGTYAIIANRQGKTHSFYISAEEIKQTPLEADFFDQLGMTLGVPAWIGNVTPDSPAAIAGLKTGDRVLAFNDEPIRDWGNLVEKLTSHPEEKVILTVDRAGNTLKLPVTPGVKIEQGHRLGYIGVSVNEDVIRLEKVSLGHAILEGIQDTLFYSLLTFESIGKMLIGQMDIKEISGPISIAVYAGNSAQIGLVYFLQFLALVSISLGVINLLPVPMLDGGHLLYYVIEIIQRKPLSLQTQQMGWMMGLVVLMLLMLIALYNDVTSIYVKF